LLRACPVVLMILYVYRLWLPAGCVQALLGQQGNMSAAPAVAARDGERSSPADKDRADSAAVSARPRAARSGKAGGAPCTPEREEPAFKTVVYSASSSVGGGRGRRALAEFSSYVVRKAPPLERRVECTLEELCSGCHKEVRYTRDVVTKNG
jgi:DnaJ homolog subfamily B member 13